MIVVTGNGDLPLATQRRVERRASLLIDRPSPSLDRIYQLGLWSAIFFAIFLRLPPNKFLRFRRTFQACHWPGSRPATVAATARRRIVSNRRRPIPVSANARR